MSIPTIQTTAPLTDRIADLFTVPDELRPFYDAIREEDVEQSLTTIGADDPVYEHHAGRDLALRLVQQEQEWLTSRAGMRPEEAAEYNRDQDQFYRRVDEVERVLRRAGTPRRYVIHARQLVEADGAYRQESARTANADEQRRMGTDPLVGLYAPTVLGLVEYRSIVGRDAAGTPGWDTVRASALVHHVASVLFAERVLEQFPELAGPIEAEVQRLIIASGLANVKAGGAVARPWRKALGL